MTTTSKTTKAATRKLDTTAVNRSEECFGSFIDSVIMGQPNGRLAARRAYRRTLSKLRTGTQPYYVIVAPGPTTSGKSELGYRMGQFYHSNRLAVLKIDGSEYKDKHNLSKLTGASPNLVGFTNRKEKDYVAPLAHERDSYAQFSQHNLTQSRLGSKVPVTIILVDEWEKACKEFNEILLSIFRDGRYTLGNGEVVDFSQCIFVITANIGSAAVEDAENKTSIGFGSTKAVVTEADADKIINDHLREFAPPEFRARVEENGEFCIFHRLTDEQIAKICDMKVRELVENTEKVAGITVDVDQSAREWLLKTTGSVPKLNGGVKSYIIDVLDNELVKGTIVAGDVVNITHVDGEDKLDFNVETQPLFVPTSLAEAEAEIARTPVPHGHLRDTEVDEASVNGLTSGVGPKDGTSDGDTQKPAALPEVNYLQPFRLVIQSTEEDLEKVSATVRAAVKGLPHSLMTEYKNNLVEPFVGTVEVMSTMIDMVNLKGRFPGLRVFIKGGELN